MSQGGLEEGNTLLKGKINTKSAKPFDIRSVFIPIICLWLGSLIIYLGRYPNQLTALIFDQWKIILPFISLMIVAFGISRKFQWRTVKISLIVVCILFSLAILNFSMWMTVYVQNKTSVPLTAVMTNLSNDRIRTISIPPSQTKLVELLTDTFGKTKWHLLVYDNAGEVYSQQIIKGEEIKRGHTIQINSPIDKDLNNDNSF